MIGLAGVMYPISTPEDQNACFHELHPVIQHMDNHFEQQISMREMAAIAGLSVTHFNRRFRSLLRLSPTEYVLALRIQAAQLLLATTLSDLAEIANKTGFYDQSHFTKRFRRATGVTPLAYRKRFR